MTRLRRSLHRCLLALPLPLPAFAQTAPCLPHPASAFDQSPNSTLPLMSSVRAEETCSLLLPLPLLLLLGRHHLMSALSVLGSVAEPAMPFKMLELHLQQTHSVTPKHLPTLNPRQTPSATALLLMPRTQLSQTHLHRYLSTRLPRALIWMPALRPHPPLPLSLLPPLLPKSTLWQ